MSFLGGLFSTLGSIGQGVGSVLGLTPWGKAAGIAGAGLGALGSSLQQDESNKSYIQGVKDINLTNREIADANNQMAYKQFLESNAFTQKMWNLNNQYNSPSAQAMRLRNAGINPTQMIESTPASQVTSSAPPALSTPHLQAANITPTVDFGKEFSTHYTQYIQHLKENEEVKGIRFANKMAETDARYRESEIIANLQKARADVEHTDMDTDVKRKTLAILDNQLQEALKTFDLRRQGLQKQNDKLDADTAYVINKDLREADELQLHRALVGAQVKLSKSQVKEVEANTSILEQKFYDMFTTEGGSIQRHLNDMEFDKLKKRIGINLELKGLGQYDLDEIENISYASAMLTAARRAFGSYDIWSSTPKWLRQASELLHVAGDGIGALRHGIR